MVKNAIYFVKPELFDLIRNQDGKWDDKKDRPLVCVLESDEIDGLYYAIPLGNLAHRDEKARKRIQRYLDIPEEKIESCFYHIGKTTVHSIFFISDIIPITDEYIDRPLINLYAKRAHIIKNKTLIAEIERKALRILAYEKNYPNYFRQNITATKNALIKELKESKKSQ